MRTAKRCAWHKRRNGTYAIIDYLDHKGDTPACFYDAFRARRQGYLVGMYSGDTIVMFEDEMPRKDIAK